jgi:hypothetical protein
MRILSLEGFCDHGGTSAGGLASNFFGGKNPNWCGRDFAPPVKETFAMVDGQRFAIAVLR